MVSERQLLNVADSRLYTVHLSTVIALCHSQTTSHRTELTAENLTIERAVMTLKHDVLHSMEIIAMMCRTTV